MQHQAVQAIQKGDTEALAGLLKSDPGLVHARLDGQRTLLHVATDWPGHFPNVRQSIELLIKAGADVNAPMSGPHNETPLHWAASSGDLEALDALLDGGANLEARGAVIGGGTALADAVAFGQWNAARRLVERGAESTIWQSAALGLLDRLERHCSADPTPDAHEITNAFWNACHGGQLEAARYLLARGAELNWIGHDRLTPLDAALRSGSRELAEWLRDKGATGQASRQISNSRS